MDKSTNPIDLDFKDVIAALLDSDTPFNPRYLYRLTDLVEDDLSQFEEIWPEIAAWRRLALLEDLEALFDADTLLSFEAICRRAMRETDSQIRFQALHSLQGYDVHDLIPEFIQILHEDQDEELRAIAAENLGKYIYLGEVDSISKRVFQEIESVLLSVAKGGDSHLVRRKAVEALGYSSHEDVPGLIKTAFYAGEPAWIKSALFAMGRTCDGRWESSVLKMLEHSVPEIRLEAIRAAGELEIAKARPYLLECLEDYDQDVQMAAIWSLSRIGGGRLKPIFEDLLKNAETDTDIQFIEEALDYLIFNQSIDFVEGLDLEDDLEYDYLVEDDEYDNLVEDEEYDY